VTAPAPATPAGTARFPAQSLARGSAGTALLLVERALAGTGSWRDAHAAVTAITAAPVDAGRRACLFYGVPALALVVHAARADGRDRYEGTARALRDHVNRVARQRLAAADARARRGEAGSFSEHDLVYGLTGIGSLLLRTDPGGDALAGVLRYLVHLAGPGVADGVELPGWWSARDPDPLAPTPGGHANLGMAHGLAGVLALLSLAASGGYSVEGQAEAIAFAADWFERWRQHGPGGPWWPEWLTLGDLRSGRPGQPGPGRPSWCYGTPGIARALQLAAIAAGDQRRQAAAEHALASSLSALRLSGLTGPGLCHGLAGTYMTALRAAQDAVTPAIGRVLPGVAGRLAAGPPLTGAPGIFTGDAGTLLALEAVRRAGPPLSGWDACLLIS
jgi:hypothetical protein